MKRPSGDEYVPPRPTRPRASLQRLSSTFDRPSDEHTHVAEMTIAKARRMVEDGALLLIAEED